MKLLRCLAATLTLLLFTGHAYAQYDSVAEVKTTTIPSTVNNLTVAGFLAPGDGGKALYVRSAAPAGDGKFQSGDGAWWLLGEAEPNELMFGAVAGASNADQTTAIQSLFNFCSAAFCSKVHILQAHTITFGLIVPSGLVVEFGRGIDPAHNFGTLIKVFNGDMLTLQGSGTRLIRPFLYGNGAAYTGRGIVCGTGAYHSIYDAFISGMAGAALDFPIGGNCTSFSSYDGTFQRQNTADPAITMPATEATTTGYRTFFNPAAGGSTLFKFNNGNMTMVFGGNSAGLDYSATSTGRVHVYDHRCACAVTILGIEHRFVNNTVGNSITIGAGTSYSFFGGNLIGGGGNIVNNSGNLTNKFAVTSTSP